MYDRLEEWKRTHKCGNSMQKELTMTEEIEFVKDVGIDRNTHFKRMERSVSGRGS